MKRLFIIATIILIPFNLMYSQNNGISKKIKAQLSGADRKNIEKAEKYYSDANAEMKLAEETESVNKKKAYKIKLKASKSFGKANKIVYKVYKQDLKQFFNNIDPVKAKKAELKIDKAALLMKEAKKKREASIRSNVAESAYSMAAKASDYEKKALEHLTDVYGMFIGSSSVVGEKRPLNDVGTETKKEGEVESITLETDNENNENETEELNVKEKKTYTSYVPIKIKGTSGVFFLIQVAASRTPISQEKLRQTYKEYIYGEQFNDWYRYVINERFATLEDAEKYKANAGIRGTLIIAIKNGQKVSIQEAQKKDVVKLNEMEYSPVGGRETGKTKTVTTPEIVYRLEIGISISRLSTAEVKKLKNGGKQVVPVDRGGWYSYTIGDFSSAVQAQNFKRIKGLSDAVVLKLKDGKVIE